MSMYTKQIKNPILSGQAGTISNIVLWKGDEAIRVQMSLYGTFIGSSGCVDVLPQRYKEKLLSYTKRQYKVARKERDKEETKKYLEEI